MEWMNDNAIYIWKVIDPDQFQSVNDKRNRVLFEGKFEECERFIENNKLKDMKLEPLHIKVRPMEQQLLDGMDERQDPMNLFEIMDVIAKLAERVKEVEKLSHEPQSYREKCDEMEKRIKKLEQHLKKFKWKEQL